MFTNASLKVIGRNFTDELRNLSSNASEMLIRDVTPEVGNVVCS